MGRKRYPPTDPREWMNRAHSNLAGTGQAAAGVYLEDLCFDAQQAAEKAIKAVFIHRGLHFPYVHDLKRLLQLLNRGGVKVPKYVWKAEELTPFAFEARYPGHPPQSHKGTTAAPCASPSPSSVGLSDRSESHEPQRMQTPGRLGRPGGQRDRPGPVPTGVPAELDRRDGG